MNRPERDAYYDNHKFEENCEFLMLNDYCWDLENYCDELEIHFTKCEQGSNEYIQRLDNALDKLISKTYELLISNGCERCPCRFDCDELQYLKGGKQNLNYMDCYKQLKEWSMKNG